MSDPDDDRVARGLLLGAAVVGIALAAWGVVTSGETPPPTPEGAVATVNGIPISRETFARFAGAVAAERKQTDLDAETRRLLLVRMIDEELLLQRGIELSLHRHEPTARRSVVSALIASVTADAEVAEPDEETLRAFHAENSERFSRPGRLRLQAALVSVAARPDPAALRQAEELARRVRAGEDFAAVESELGDRQVAPLPDGALPLETVRQYLGPTPARTALGLKAGEVSDPVRGSAGYYVLRLLEHAPGEVAPFEESVAEVRAEWLRARGEAALRDYLASLRDGADIVILDPELRVP